MRSNPPEYIPEVVAHWRADERYLRAVDRLAEVLDVHVETADRLACDRQFVEATADLPAVKVRLAIEWQRQQRDKENA